MTVVAALKLDELAAAGGAARQANRAHGGLGTGTDQAHHVHGRNQAQNFFGQLNFAFSWRAVRKAFKYSGLYRFYDRRVPVSQNHGAPRANKVGVTLVIGIPEIGALGAFDKTWRATNCLEGPDR